jgi:hypothetical protein
VVADPVTNGRDGRDQRGQFVAGNKCSKGNPNIRRLGEIQTAIREASDPADVKAVLAMVRDKAIAGDIQAARVYLERVAGKPTEPRVPVALPDDIGTAGGAAAGMTEVAAALARGDVGPGDASALASVLRCVLEANAVASIEARLAALEGKT